MASPQTEDGFTRIANELLEALMKVELSGQEFRVAFVILRKTYGFNCKVSEIPLSNISTLTGLHSRRCSQVMSRLETMKIVTLVSAEQGLCNKYMFNKDFDKWTTSAPLQKTAKVGTLAENCNTPLQKTAKVPLQKTATSYKVVFKDTIKDTYKDMGKSETGAKAKRVLDYHYQQFEKLHHKKMELVPTRDMKIYKDLLAGNTEQELIEYLDIMFSSPEPWIYNGTHNTPFFKGIIDRLKIIHSDKQRGIS